MRQGVAGFRSQGLTNFVWACATCAAADAQLTDLILRCAKQTPKEEEQRQRDGACGCVLCVREKSDSVLGGDWVCLREVEERSLATFSSQEVVPAM